MSEINTHIYIHILAACESFRFAVYFHAQMNTLCIVRVCVRVLGKKCCVFYLQKFFDCFDFVLRVSTGILCGFRFMAY